MTVGLGATVTGSCCGRRLDSTPCSNFFSLKSRKKKVLNYGTGLKNIRLFGVIKTLII
jgi:hypothetical protein